MSSRNMRGTVNIVDIVGEIPDPREEPPSDTTMLLTIRQRSFFLPQMETVTKFHNWLNRQ